MTGPSDETPPEARHQEKDTFQWAKLAAGIGLAATALTGCTDAVPPAANAGNYDIGSPELVVMSQDIQRIDINRETDRECSGFGEDESCHDVDVAYHPIGIHMGEGVVQDFNGNLFAAPQLVTQGSPGTAVANPEQVYADGPLGTTGTLKRRDEDTFRIRGSIFGRADIDVSDKNIVVNGRGLFGSYEAMNILNSGGVTDIKEGRFTQAYVQSQGDHVLVQSKYGRTLAEIRHEDGSGKYQVTRPGLFGGYNMNVTYNDNQVSFDGPGWGDSLVSSSTNGKGEEVVSVKSGPFTTVTTTEKESGWNDDYFGPGSIEYTYHGGKVLPGN